ncbi:tol-pal system YbgF family protein [Leptospira sp. WS58.C1]|uniref:tetratricopeptide repeat protein n=1 Tax=Leptospira TaxID=171 RepID=UPI0002BF7890|nr:MULTISPECIES: tetratricopeptide repeat protein [unclassified Leptospira]EMK00322.1 hypothetical protein LEP1GSC192_2134 [Leptospira sp. B5-022]MCR1793768.1 tetratricopeptide repeat protein [Leptospira sp. id769339]
MKIVYTFFIILFIPISWALGEGMPEDYPEIKKVLESGNFTQAQEMLDPLLQSKPSDPTLALYQAEIWIRKAESYYQEGRKLSAFEFFKKAYEVWPNHSLVRNRYWELHGKPLKDSMPNSQNRNSSTNFSGKTATNQKTVFVFDPELQELSAELKEEMKKNISDLQAQRAASEDHRSWETKPWMKWIWLSVGSAIGFLVGISASIFLRRKV